MYRRLESLSDDRHDLRSSFLFCTRKTITCSVNVFMFPTLCHRRGCWVPVASDARIQSADVALLGETTFVASPLRPTYFCNEAFHDESDNLAVSRQVNEKV